MKVSTKLTRRRKQTIYSLIFIGVLVVIFVLLMGFAFSHLGKQFNESNKGIQVCIEWEKVNLRTGYSTSKEIITTLSKGSIVTLTGNSYGSIGSGIPSDNWMEVQLSDGTIGWVVESSIKWN